MVVCGSRPRDARAAARESFVSAYNAASSAARAARARAWSPPVPYTCAIGQYRIRTRQNQHRSLMPVRARAPAGTGGLKSG